QAHEITVEQPTYGEYGQRMRDTLIAEIAVASATCGFYEQAVELPDEITDSDEKLRALIKVAQTAANSEQYAYIRQASDKLEDEVSKASFWLSLSESFRANDQSESFDDAIVQSIHNAERITMPYEQSLIL